LTSADIADHCSRSIRSTISRRSFAGSEDLVLRLAEHQAEQAAVLAERLQHVAAVRLQLVAVARQQARPIRPRRHGRLLVPRRAALLVGHLEEQQERELLDVVAVREPVVPQDAAVVPQLRDDLLGLAAHSPGALSSSGLMR
jgi:hypothetical protein